MNINRIFTEIERSRLHPNEQAIISHYEKATGNTFKRFDLLALKEAVQTSTPAQIMNAISTLYKKYPENFTRFSYVNPYLRIYKNRKGDKNEQN
ncbi:hypothetical protein [Bacillus bombysepticus]|uniref:hypothetical protein n=1 Tax=Bacillus bombysepticus TaxID=658666 RepID=UPI003018DA29